jgi:protein disulfide-isomerase A1
MKSIILLTIILVVLHAEVIPFDNAAVDKIFQQKQPALFLFVGDENTEASAIEAFNAYDSTNPSIILTLSTSTDGNGLFERLAEYLGVDINSTPQIIYLNSESLKYKFGS